MTDTQQDDVYTGSTIEEDIFQEVRHLSWELMVACLDTLLAMMAATMFIWLYCSLVAEWIDVFGKIIVGIRHVSLVLPFFSITLIVFAISRIYAIVCLWRDRCLLLS